ncbi:MAG: dipeptidase [Candidatus Cryptobacteroides sp.]|jgi:membrane dipeptidase
MLVLDSHCDTPSQLMRGRDIGKNNVGAQVDLPKLKAGGVDAAFFALYTPKDLSPDASTRYALEMLGAVFDALEARSDQATLALTPEDARTNKSKGLLSIFLGMENGAPIQRSLSLLRIFYRLGVRYLTLTHNGDNEIGDAASEGSRWHGLSPFGREVVAEMNRLGMIVDIAHASDETFYDCIRCSRSPIVSTHSCCRALADHPRNLTDEMLRTLADHGGVVQINFYPVFLSDPFAEALRRSGLRDKEWIEREWIADPANPEKIAAKDALFEELAALPRPSWKMIVDHIDHAVRVAGIEHVGIGSDFDGIEVTPKGMEDVSKMGKIFAEMHRRGYSDDEIEKVAGANFLRVFNEVIANSL